MKIFSFLFLLFLSSTDLLAETVKIFGKDLSYAGSKIEIRHHTDVFTYSEEIKACFEVQPDGNFSVEFDLSETQLVFLPLGIYKGFLFIEPGRQYELKLPQKTELTPIQKLNPFLEKEELLIGVINADKSELNFLIRKLDDKLDSFTNQNFNKIYRKKDQSVGVEFTKQVTEEFSEISNQFFIDYMNYRLGFLEFLAYPNEFLRIETKYFSGKEIKLNNPAYMSLYKKQYGNFLTGFISKKEGAEISKAMNSADTYKQLNSILAKYPTYQNNQFRDLILATSIFDGYSRQFYSRKKTLEILSKIKESTKNDYNRNLCSNYIRKITHLQKNYPAPSFSVGNHNLADYKGKYLYLNFCNTQSYPCQQDFIEIKKLKQQFGQHIEFLSIACDWDINQFNNFMANNSFDWPIVSIGDQQHLIESYNIKVFPSYILIDPKGNILKASAPGPKENIHLEFIKIARDVARQTYEKKN